MICRATILCALLLAGLAAAEPAAGLVFKVESLNVSLRLPLAGGQPQPELRLVLTAEQPRSIAVLRLDEPRFTTVATDSGELLGLLQRPANRVQTMGADRQAQRDRSVRLTFDLTPPRNSVQRLLAVQGSVQVTLGAGEPGVVMVPVAPPAAAPMAMPGLAEATVQVEVVSGQKIALILSPSLAGRLSGITFCDAAGATAVVKGGQAKNLDGGALRLQYDLEGTSATRARIAWFPEVRSERVQIDIAGIDIPGGIPGIGDATATAPAKPIAVGGAPGWTALHQAVNAASLETVTELLEKGADPWAQGKDGRSAIDMARDQGRWVILRRLLGNK